MTSPESGPRGPNDADRVIAETGEKLRRLFRDGLHGADIESSREYYRPGKEYKEYPSTPHAEEEAFMEVWDAQKTLTEGADKKTLEKVLTLLDTAIAIHNDPKYRKMRQDVLRRLVEIEGKS